MIQDNETLNQYYSILSMLTRIHHTKKFQIGDIIEWCAECETEYLQDVDNMNLFVQIPLHAKDGRVLLPCNVYRILDVYTDPNNENSRIEYYKNGQYLRFRNHREPLTIYVNYYGISIDLESGLPILPNDHYQALSAFCLKNVYYEDYLNGLINGQQWQFICDDFSNKARETAYNFRQFDRNDLAKLEKIIYSQVHNIGNMSFIQHEEGIHPIYPKIDVDKKENVSNNNVVISKSSESKYSEIPYLNTVKIYYSLLSGNTSIITTLPNTFIETNTLQKTVILKIPSFNQMIPCLLIPDELKLKDIKDTDEDTMLGNGGYELNQNIRINGYKAYSLSSITSSINSLVHILIFE